MPYINKQKRRAIESGGLVNAECGDLNFMFTKISLLYLQDRGLSYQSINDVIGALECCKQEMYRRVAIPYEEIKIQEQGDIEEFEEIQIR